MKKYFTVLLFLFSITSSLSAQKKYQSLLWEISGNGLDKPSYLYGTMHVSSKLAFHLGDSFFLALKNVDMVALEIHPETWVDDMLAYDPYTFWQGGGGYYGRGKTKSKEEQRKDAVKEALRKDPSLINYYLFRSQGYSGNFEEDTYLDLYIFQTGKKLKKKTAGLELMSELMLNLEEAERAQKEEYKYKKKRRNYYDDEGMNFGDALEDAYRKGDLDAIDSLNLVDGTPGYLEHMLYIRNQAMADRMDSIMTTANLRLFAGMGASHLPGERGVIEMLREKGYTLRAMQQGERATKQKRKIDNIVIQKDFDAKKPFDNYFEVDLPGKMYELIGSGATRSYFHPDMANGAYYTVTRIKTYARELEHSTEYVLKSVDSLLYENIPGKILSQKKVNRQGFDGYSITTRTRRGDIQRFEILITPEEIFVFKLGGTGEFAENKEADKFFKSIKVKTPKATNWQSFSSPDGTFSAQMPHAPLFYGDTSILAYFSPEPFTAIDFNTNNVYSITKSNFYLTNSTTIPDSLLLEQAMFSFSESKYYDELERKFTQKDDHQIMDARYRIDKDFNMQVRYILRKGYIYILSVKYKTDSTDADKFVQSLTFSPEPKVTYEEYSDTLLHFTVTTTSQKNALEGLIKKLSRYKAKDKPYKTLHETKVFIENPKSYASVTVGYTRHGLYRRFKDSASYWKDFFDGINSDSTLIILNKKIYKKNGFTIADVDYTDTGCTFAVKKRKMLRNAVSYDIYTAYDREKGPSEFVTKFYQTFTPKDTVIGQSMFSDNVDIIVNNLVNGDSATHAEAYKSLRAVWVKEKDFKIWTAVIDTLQPENEDYFDYKSSFIEEMWNIKTPENIKYLSELFYKAGDTSTFQLSVLKTLLNLETAESFNTFKELLLDETPLGKKYQINSLFWRMDDSLELTAKLYPDLFGLFLLEEYREKMVGVLATLVDSNAIDINAYKSFLSTLKIEAKNQLKRKKANKVENDEDYSGYNSYSRYRNRYTRYSNNQSSYLGDLATVLIPFYNEKSVQTFFNKLLKYQDDKLRLSIALKLMKANHPVPDTLWKEISKHLSWRAPLYEALEDAGKLNLYPKKYKNQDSMTRAMVEGSVGSRNSKLDTITLASKRFIEFDGKKGYVYLYKYRMEDSKIWKLAMLGLQPENKKEVNTSTKFFSISSSNKVNETIPLEKQFSVMLKKAMLEQTFKKYLYGYGNNYDYDDEYAYDEYEREY